MTKDWHEASKIGVRANYKKLLSFLSKEGKITEKEGIYTTTATLEDINEFLIINCGRIDSYQSITVRVSDFSKLFTEVLGIQAKFSNIPPSEVVKNNEGIYTKEEIEVICEQFINSQDKFLIYGIWYGLKDKRFDDITNIKKSDVDFENKTIKVGEKIIKMDSTLEMYCLSAIQEVVYYKLGDIGDSTSESYDLNIDSPYIIKTKPQRNNNNGLNRMTFNGLRTRIANLNSSLEEYDVLLKPQKLYMGGVIYKMYEESMRYNITWNNSTMKEFKDKYNISAFSTDTLLLYKSKYN